MKYVPLRDLGLPFLRSGYRRAASSLHNPADVTIEGERIRPSAQIPKDPGVNGGMSWAEMDKRNSRSGK